MTTFPTAPVVSKALRRDVRIITVDTSRREGYSVHRGGGGYHGPSIWVSVSDAERTNVRHAVQLAAELTEVYGWDVELADNSSIIYVNKVPGKVDAAKALAKFEDEAKAALANKVVERLQNGGMPSAIAKNLSFL